MKAAKKMSEEKIKLQISKRICSHYKKLPASSRPSYREIAARCDKTAAWAHGVINGNITPSIASLHSLCGVLGINMEELF